LGQQTANNKLLRHKIQIHQRRTADGRQYDFLFVHTIPPFVPALFFSSMNQSHHSLKWEWDIAAQERIFFLHAL
jgi:hypothetical protein